MMGTVKKFVFVSSNGQLPVANSYSTFSVLFSGVLAVNYVQPWFGGNYIEVSFKPTAEGGLPLGAIATAQLRTDGRGLYEFYATMKQVMEVARKKQQEATTLRESLSLMLSRVGRQFSLYSCVYATKERYECSDTACGPFRNCHASS